LGIEEIIAFYEGWGLGISQSDIPRLPFNRTLSAALKNWVIREAGIR